MTETYRYHRQTKDDKRNCSLQGKLPLPESAGAMNQAVAILAMAMAMNQGAPLCLSRKAQMPRLGSRWIPMADPVASGQCGRDRSRCGTGENVGRNCTGGIAFHGIADFV